MSKSNKKNKALPIRTPEAKVTQAVAQAPAAPVVAPVSKAPVPSAPTERKPVVAAKAPTPASVPTAASPAQAKPASNSVLLEFIKPNAHSVFVAGSFNQWKPDATPLTLSANGRWVGKLSVKPGRHEYLFVVDGQWEADPNAKEYVGNPFGGRNSVLVVSE